MAKTKTATKRKQTTKVKTKSKTGAGVKAAKPSKSLKKAPPRKHGPDQEVTICRRRTDRRKEKEAELEDEDGGELTELLGASAERRKVPRRRQIDPTTCERDYTNDEIEFMHALDAYKRSSGRMFPTCSEVLEVVRSLGYCKPAVAGETPAIIETVEAESPTVELELASV